MEISYYAIKIQNGGAREFKIKNSRYSYPYFCYIETFSPLRWSHTHFICIPAVHIISFCVSFLSWVDELNNWPAPGIWVFIAHLGEHCSANAEATSSNPVEAPKNFFSDYFRYCLNCDSLRW